MRRLCRNRMKSRLRGGFYFARERRWIVIPEALAVTAAQRTKPESPTTGISQSRIVSRDNSARIEFQAF